MARLGALALGLGGLSLVAIVTVVGCGSNESADTTPAGDDDANGTGDDADGTDASVTLPGDDDDDPNVAKCVSIEPATTSIGTTTEQAALPAPEGGTIVDGTYVLTAATFYLGVPAKAAPVQKNGKYRFSGATVEYTSVRGAALSGPQSFKFTSAPGKDAQHLALKCDCGQPDKCPAPSLEIGYSVRVGDAGNAELWVYPPDSMEVQIFTKQ